ncbi:MAG TPA: branched-chain amino acid ABC transporter permease [Sporichthyaceae bacterium]|nr:branched-chain amino acid ABC transporter permease [Sporichthyaceae bacterium]
MTSVTLASRRSRTHQAVDTSEATFAGVSRGRNLGIGRWLLLAVGVVVGLEANNYWLFIVQMSFIMGIVALGTLIVSGYAREITLMQAGLTGSAIYISGWAYRSNYNGLGWPFPLALGFGVVVVVAISVAVALASARLSAIYVLVLTLAVQFTLENSLFTSGTLTGGLQAPFVPRPNFYGISLAEEHNEYFFLLALSVVLVVLVERFRHCRFGRAMMAVGYDKHAAAAMGMNPWMYRVGAFALGGLFAGIGGSLWAPQLGAPPGADQFSSMESLFYLAIPVLAGFDSIPTVFVTAMVFMTLPMALEQYHFQPLLLGGVALLIGVVLGPRGFGGFTVDLAARLRKAWAADGARGLLKLVARPRRPGWMRLPNRKAARAYQTLRAEESTATCWSSERRGSAIS